jgi:outer membrane immunogenic protein
MKKFLVASAGAIALFAALAAQPAAAADMPVKAPAPVVAIWTWDGFYIGGNVGYSWGRADTDVEYFNPANGVAIVPPAGSITGQNFNMNGWVAGGQVGFNVQRNNWVYGIEVDGQWTGQKGDTSFLCAAVPVTAGVCLPGLTFLPAGLTGTTLSLEQKLEWFVTLRGRVGVLTQPNTLLYVTGGFAFGQVKASGVLGSALANGQAVSLAFSDSDVNAGWTVGAGIEHRLFGNWTGKLEYIYLDLGTFNYAVQFATTPAIGARISSDVTDHIVRIGLNYKWGSTPVVARY